MESSQTTYPQMRAPSAANIIVSYAWSQAGGAMAGLVGGASFGTILFPVFGTLYGAVIGAVVGVCSALLIGPAMAAAALLGKTPAERQRSAQKIAVISNLILSAIVAEVMYIENLMPVLMAVFLAPTTVGAAWTGAFVARSTVDKATATQLESTSIKMFHVGAVSAATAVLSWVAGLFLQLV